VALASVRIGLAQVIQLLHAAAQRSIHTFDICRDIILGMISLPVEKGYFALDRGHGTLRCTFRNTAASTGALHRSIYRNCRAQGSASRRYCIGAFLAAHLVFTSPAEAGFLESFVKASQTDDISTLDATVRLLDGVSILKQIQVCSFTWRLTHVRCICATGT
jgi:hypothetical protein